MYDFVIIMFYITHKYAVPIILLYLTSRIIIALFLREIGYDKWYISLIPLGHLYIKLELGAVAPWLLILTALFNVLAFYTLDLIFTVLSLIFNTLSELSYSKIAIDDYSRYLWSLVPGLKYALMIREVIKCRR